MKKILKPNSWVTGGIFFVIFPLVTTTFLLLCPPIGVAAYSNVNLTVIEVEDELESLEPLGSLVNEKEKSVAMDYLLGELEMAYYACYHQESRSGSNKNVGADGPLQTKAVVVKEVNSLFTTEYTYSDRTRLDKSTEMFYLYTTYWGMEYYKKTGNLPNKEIFVRIWNGGPKGHRKESTRKYLEKSKEFWASM